MLHTRDDGSSHELIVKAGDTVWRDIIKLISNPGLLSDGVPYVENVADFAILNRKLVEQYKCNTNSA